ncbi:hypothetical protein ACFLU4_01890 [Chloroflexota bacterium]
MTNKDQGILIQKFVDTFFGGHTSLLMAIITAGKEMTRLDEMNLAPEEFLKFYRDSLTQEWKRYSQELSNAGITHIEHYWWYQLFWDTGMSNGEINSLLWSESWGEPIRDLRSFNIIESIVEEGKVEGSIPSNITALEFMTMLFTPIDLQLHPGDPVYRALNVKSGKELRDKFPSVRLLFAKIIVDGTFDKGLLRAILHDLKRDYSSSETHYPRLSTKSINRLIDSGLIHRGYEYEDNEGNKTPNIIDGSYKDDVLTDQERIEYFGRLAGISINELTPRDQTYLIELLHVVDMGYEFSSKQGLSIKDFYGDKADSKKTTRSRLFKKVKDLEEKAKTKST